MPRDVYKDLARLRAKHAGDRSLLPSKIPNLKPAPGLPSLSDGFAPVIDNRAKTLADRFRNEDKRVADEIQAKANRIRITVSKSAYQYATDSDDPRTVHRKHM